MEKAIRFDADLVEREGAEECESDEERRENLRRLPGRGDPTPDDSNHERRDAQGKESGADKITFEDPRHDAEAARIGRGGGVVEDDEENITDCEKSEVRYESLGIRTTS